ncbi:MAG: hypothetical protein V2A74_09725, partial [bacterium]
MKDRKFAKEVKMRKFWKQRSTFIALGLVAGMMVIMKSSCEAAESKDFAFKFGTDKQEYVLGEPVTLTIYVTNRTAEKKTVRSNFNVVGDLELRVAYNNELPRRAKSHFRPAIYPHVPLEIAPYQVGRRVQTLLYDEENESGYLFDKPGVYTLSARLEYYLENSASPEETRIEPIQIRFSQPDKRGQEALAILWKKAVAYDYNKFQATDASVEAFKTVAEQYPDTPYAPYALYSLARMRMSPATAIRESYAESVRLLERLIRNYPDSPLLEDSYYLIIAAYYRTEEGDMAAKYGKEMREKFPNVVVARG